MSNPYENQIPTYYSNYGGYNYVYTTSNTINIGNFPVNNKIQYDDKIYMELVKSIKELVQEKEAKDKIIIELKEEIENLEKLLSTKHRRLERVE